MHRQANFKKRYIITIIIVVLLLHIIPLFYLYKYSLKIGLISETSSTVQNLKKTLKKASVSFAQSLKRPQQTKQIKQVKQIKKRSEKPKIVETKKTQEVEKTKETKQIKQEKPKVIASTTTIPKVSKPIQTKKPEIKQVKKVAKTVPKAVPKPKAIAPKKLKSQTQHVKQQKATPQKKRLPISINTFLNSFRASYKNEQQYYQQTPFLGSSPSSSNTSSSDQKNIIKQRLGEWKLAHYMQRVNQAFVDAVRRTAPISLNLDRSFTKDIVITLEILKDGSINILYFESTGVTEIDNYIKAFLRDINPGPIPKRFGVNSTPPFNRIFRVHAKKEAAIYSLSLQKLF